MKPLHKIIMVGTTFVLAAATGHVMQNPARFGLQEQQAGANSAALVPGLELRNVQQVANIEADTAPVQVSGLQIEGQPQLPATPQLRTPGNDVAVGAMPVDVPATGSGFTPLDGLTPPAPAELTTIAPRTCAEPTLQWRNAASASVLISIAAPCDAGQMVVLEHEGLRLPITLSDRGDWSGVVPALVSDAVITATLPDGTQLSAEEKVSGLEKVNRVVLAGKGTVPLALHGLEYGSDFNEVGDVHALAPRTADTPLGGWMAAFSAPGVEDYAQIYTAPVNLGDLRLEIEAPVDAEACGIDTTAQVQRVLGGKLEAAKALSIALPECDDAEGAVMMRLPDFPMSLASN